MKYYQERKDEIAAGIWPANDTQIVPVQHTDKKKVIPDADAGTVTILTPMSARDIERDAKLDALPPGKRFTDAGTVYYEYRKNRSDYPGSI